MSFYRNRSGKEDIFMITTLREIYIKVSSEIKKFTVPNLTQSASHIVGFFGPRGGVQSSLCNETVNIAGIYIAAGIISNAFPLVVEVIRFKNIYEIIRDARNIVGGKKEEIVKGIISLQRDVKSLEEFVRGIHEYDLRTLRDFQNRVKMMHKDIEALKFQVGELEFDINGEITKLEILKPPNVINKISGAVSGMVFSLTAAVMPSTAPATNGTMNKLSVLSKGLTASSRTSIEPSPRHVHFITEKDLANLKSELEDIKDFEEARLNVREFIEREMQLYWGQLN